jgi:hypothetical protein
MKENLSRVSFDGQCTYSRQRYLEEDTGLKTHATRIERIFTSEFLTK